MYMTITTKLTNEPRAEKEWARLWGKKKEMHGSELVSAYFIT